MKIRSRNIQRPTDIEPERDVLGNQQRRDCLLQQAYIIVKQVGQDIVLRKKQGILGWARVKNSLGILRDFNQF